jgi:phosphate transport system permease protein
MSGFTTRESGVRLLLFVAASTSTLIVALIFLFLGKEAWPFLQDPGGTQLIGSRWVPVSFEEGSFGLLPLVWGTILVTMVAMAMAVPLGVMVAIYIADMATPWERTILKPLIDVLAAIPSVVLGFFGLVALSPWVKSLFGLPTGTTALTGSILLAVMALPTIVSISEEAIRRVPRSLKTASLALGASPLQTTWKVTVPAASRGIVASVTLGISRVAGETMVVLMVTGNAAQLALSPLKSVRTMTATVALEMGEVTVGSDHYRALFCIGLILLTGTFVLNVLARRALVRQSPAK